MRETHIAIAAFSRAFEPRPEPGRSRTVLETALIHLQKRVALEFIYCEVLKLTTPLYKLSLWQKKDGDQPHDSHER
jgi:hypothetical protein